jgi:hypothetical protein
MLMLRVQTPCVNTTNTYTQAVTVTYSNAPASGNLVVNGQSFAITSSPQTVVLTNLPSNGASVNITAAFSAVPACTYTLNSAFTAPAGCLCPTINVSVTATTPVTNCTAPNGSITVAANGGTGSFTYAWTPSAFGSGTTLTNIPSGTYSVIATDGNGCTGSTSGSVTNASGVNALISNVSNVSCFNGNNGAISISTTGGTAPISFTWSDQGFASTIASRTNLVAGSYVIAVSDAGGCSVVLGPINITQPNQLVATVDNSSNVTCAGLTNGAINVTTTGGNGGNQYVWTNGGGSTEDISGLAAGSYQLTVTDNKGCQATTSSVTITAPSAILITTNSQSNVSCFGAADADILVTVTGGTGAYDFDWNNAPDMEDVLNVGPGSYQLTVTDANNCVQTSPNFTVTQPQQLVVNIVSQENVSCNGANDGQIVASATGGTGVLDILWTNGAGTSLTASNLAPNSYQLSVTDDNNCSVTTNITTITQPSILIALATSTPSAVGGSTGTATATPSGGTAPYTYKWSDPNAQTTSAATGLSAGSYTCLVTDANGCTTTIPVSVGVADAIGELALKSLKVYPNPNNGVFTIQFETTESLDFEIKLLNTIGKEVYVQTYSNVNGIFTEQFAFNQLASGIYFLEISNNDSKSVTRISINK